MKNIFLKILIGLLILSIGVFTKFYLDEINFSKMNFVHKFIFERVIDEWEEEMLVMNSHERNLVDYNSLLSLLGTLERSLVERLFEINPIDLGFKGKFFSTDTPDNLIKIESVKLLRKNKPYQTGIQYLPAHVNHDYEIMMLEMDKEIGKKLFVDSGFRSAGRQAYLFIFYLVRSNDFSLRENAKWIAMPGYSEHGSAENTAIDFVNIDGINGINESETAEDFERLEEYDWLIKNASKFNFYLSYPRGNKYGVSFEPWHWHWEKR